MGLMDFVKRWTNKAESKAERTDPIGSTGSPSGEQPLDTNPLGSTEDTTGDDT